MHLLMKALHMHLQTQASHHIDHILLTVFFISPWVQPICFFKFRTITKYFLQSSQVIKCSCLEQYVYFAFGSNNIKCYQFFFNCYHYHAALKSFKCLLAPKFQRFACHHPLYQYPRSDSRFWLPLSFLVSYITRVELRYRANYIGPST